MSIVMALLFLIAGVFCIQRPRVVAGWIALLFKGAGNRKSLAWLQSRGMLLFIRVIGFLALVNATMYFYLARQVPTGFNP